MAHFNTECNDPLDVLFILDDSSRVGERKFTATKKFIRKLLEMYDVSDYGLNVGLITYNSYARVHLSPPVR